MKLETTSIEGISVLRPHLFEDERGFFLEAFRIDVFEKLGLPTAFQQENHSQSKRGVVRGLHFQWDPPMGKLMRVTSGRAFLVAVDLRKQSPTLGQWHGIEVSAENKLQVWAPPGFARGFAALSDIVDVQYKCTGIYNPRCESGILWNDPQIGIEWPLNDAQLSDKDAKAQTLAEWLERPESNNFAC